jgi:hypothetical protein
MQQLTLQKLPVRLKSDSGLVFYLAVSREKPTDGSHHGFGIVISSNAPARLDPIQYRSGSDQTDHMKAALGGALTILEWVDLNCEPNMKCIAYTNESYIYQHLRPRIKQWLQEKKRANLGLLNKLAPLLDKYPLVEFSRETSWSPELREEAKLLASVAAGHPDPEPFE